LFPVLLASIHLIVSVSPLPAQGAPVAPNEASILAELLALDPVHSSALHIEPPQTFTRFRLKILSVTGVPGLPNPVHGREGQIIEALSRETASGIAIGRTVRATVAFRGDERGGRFWLRDIEEAMQ
jgi:hypothetical protein